jgi:hypothetical protein
MPKVRKSARSIRDLLRDAQESQDLVWVKRTGRGWQRREGYVLQIGPKWMLMATPDDRVRPDGYSLLRTKDVASVTRGKTHDRLFRQHLEMHGHWPPQLPPSEVDLTGLRAAIGSLAAQFPLVCLFTEEARPNVCYIGSVTKMTDRNVEMIEITTQGEWKTTLTRWKLHAITRVDVDGGYERALAEVGGTPPTI